MSMVTDCRDDHHVQTELADAQTRPVIADFYATWCGPCQMIAPTFRDLAGKYPEAKFLKINVDTCKSTKDKYSINSMPTFLVLINGQVMDQLSGADPNALHDLVKKWALGAKPVVKSPIPNMVDLNAFLQDQLVECLNEKDTNTLAGLLAGQTDLQSDVDEQLILNIPFRVPVKIHSIELRAPAGSEQHAPKKVKVFVNNPATIGFDQAQDSHGLQELNFETGALQPLNFVKAQNVRNVQLFVENNVGDLEETRIADIRFYGLPMDSMNMANFKRVTGKIQVAGKAGEGAGGH